MAALPPSGGKFNFSFPYIPVKCVFFAPLLIATLVSFWWINSYSDAEIWQIVAASVVVGLLMGLATVSVYLFLSQETDNISKAIVLGPPVLAGLVAFFLRFHNYSDPLESIIVAGTGMLGIFCFIVALFIFIGRRAK